MWLDQLHEENPMSAIARTTGWAAIAYAIIYVGAFVSNILLSIIGPASGVRYRTPDQMRADFSAAMSVPSASRSWVPP